MAFVHRGSVFFLQQRPGLNSFPFKIIKFKTMRDSFDSNGIPLPDEERLTKVGHQIMVYFDMDADGYRTATKSWKVRF